MPRKGNIVKRKILPDPVYNNIILAKLINNLMIDGKKSIAENICYNAFKIIEKKTGKDPLKVFLDAMENVMPMLEVKARRVGGANYQVPIEVRPERRQSLGIRWLIKYTRARSGKSMEQKLANEIIDSSQGIGASVKKKEDTHKMAEANKAFVHYKW